LKLKCFEKIKKKNTNKTFPLVSFIVPTLNAEKTIKFCLNSITDLNYPKDLIEIILIDNGSTDNTLRVAQTYNIKIFVKPELTIGGLRNFGAKVAKGDIFAFVDSDCIIEKNWLKNTLKVLSNPSVGATGCGYEISPNASWVEKSWFVLREASRKKVNFIPAGNLIIKRKVFEQVGGFDENLITGEDYNLCDKIKRAGYLVISDNSIRAVHLGNPKTLRTFFKKEIWYGLGMISSSKDFANKIVILSHVFLFLLITLLYAVFQKNFLLFLSTFVIILFIISISAFYRNFIKPNKSRNVKYFFYLIPLYFLYFLGRSVSLLHIYKRWIINKFKNIRFKLWEL